MKMKLSDELEEIVQLSKNLEVEYNVGNLTSAFDILENLIELAETVRSKFDL